MQGLINTAEEAEKLLQRLQQSSRIVYDAETSGLDWKTNHIIGHVITFGPDPRDSFYVPVRHRDGGNLEGCRPEPEAVSWQGAANWFEDTLIEYLNRQNMKICFHNGAFDMKFLTRIGFKKGAKTEDTMIAAYLVDELRRSFSLDACCRDEGVQEKKGMALYQRIAEYTNQPLSEKRPQEIMAFLWMLPGDDDVVVDYSAGDGTSTWQLMDALWEKIKKPYYENQFRSYDLQRVAEVEFALMPVLNKMMTRGIKIDLEYFAELTKQIGDEYQEAAEKIGDLNVRSRNQMMEYFRSHDIENWPMTPKGNPSFNEKWLLTTEPGQRIVKARKFRTLHDSYLKPMRERHIVDGRLYVNYSQTMDEDYGTKTGRLSAHDPNITGQPGKRQGELGKRFRTAYIPDRGNWISADYQTCEIVVCCHYCKAAVWLEGFKNGVKAHQSVSDAIGIPYQHAKTINLGLMTGMGKNALAEDLGIPLNEAITLVNQYFDGLPEVKRFQKKSMANFRNRGFVSTLLGRRLQLDDARFAYRALNRLTQGGNADIIKERMVAMDEVADHNGSELILNVHDDISFECDEKEQAVEMVDCMKDMSGVGLSLPMQVDWGRGPNWGVATFNEEGW